MPETATEKAIREREDQRQRERLTRTIEAFSAQWGPDDRRDLHRFHAELHMLVREIHADAQRPVVDTVRNVMAAMPHLPIMKSN